MSGDDLKLFLYTIIGFIIGLVLFFKGFKWMKQKQMIENIPTSKIRSLAMGLVEIKGKVISQAGKVLKSPFSQSDCVYYKYTIEEYRRSGKHSRWVTIDKGEKGDYFYLKDDTGSVLVYPIGAEVNISLDNEFGSGFGRAPNSAITSFINENKLLRLSFGNPQRRYKEYFIAPNDELYILGTADDNPFVDEATAKMGVEDVMIKKGNNESFFYISDKPENKLLSSLRWKTFGGLFGGLILLLVCLFFIFAFLRLV
ncbi:MAG: E3 ubiquitin ligase family protein [Nanoarchaeota archaeon]|nr:E3 ubiquitin ligase family protein [Nanoarchaeota archaeon]MBU1854389.1 E3 ubiquitin ligase family protein [Nanoarchaeota archaeon]